LRANGSRERAPDDWLPEAIQGFRLWIASEPTLLAMTSAPPIYYLPEWQAVDLALLKV